MHVFGHPCRIDDLTGLARERGWRLILPALGLFLLVPAFAALRVLVPVEQTILLVGPAIAVCALVGWMQGGRLWLALTWMALSAWMLLRPLEGTSAFEFMARGWAAEGLDERAIERSPSGPVDPSDCLDC